MDPLSPPEPGSRREDPPVFVSGMPRSGTTLLSTILATHPDLTIPHETDYYRVYVPRCGGDECLRDRDSGRAFVRRYLETDRVGKFDFPPSVLEEVEEAILGGPLTHRRILGTLMRAHARQQDAVRWGEKTPAHVAHVPRIQEDWPEARFLGILRDPRDVSLSLSKRDWGASNPARHAHRWREYSRMSRRYEDDDGIPYRAVRFEDLVTEPEAAVQGICAFLDLEWDPRMLRFHENPDKPVDPDEQGWHTNLGRPIDPSMAGKWRDQLGAAHVATVEGIAGDEMERQGYAPSDPDLGLSARLRSWGHRAGAPLRDRLQTVEWVVRNKVLSLDE